MSKALCLFLLMSCCFICMAQDDTKDSAGAAKYMADCRAVFLSDRQSSLSSALSGLAISDRLHLVSLSANFSNIAGSLYSYMAKYELSLQYLNKALVLAQELKDESLISKIYTNIGLNYRQQGDQQKAIEISLKAARVAEHAGFITNLGNIYANISESFYSLKMHDKAIAYGDSALIYFRQLNNSKGMASVYNTRGVIYADKMQYDSAVTYYAKSLQIKKEANDVGGQANTLTNMGSVYTDLKKFDRAQASFAEAKKLYAQLNDPKGLVEVAQNMALLKKAQKDTSALHDTKLVFDAAKRNTTIDQQRDIALSLSQMYRDKKDFQNGLRYFEIYDSLKDATISVGALKQVTEMETKYQAERKQHQIELLNNQSRIQQLEIGKRNITIAIIAIAFILSGLLVFQAYSRSRIQQEARLQAEVIRQQALASKGIIDAEERERKRLAAELHDGVGQLFSTVRMNMEMLVNKFLVKQPEADLLAEKTLLLVDESCTEVRSIAHQMMPNALIKSGLVAALRDFINKIPSEKLQVSFATKGLDAPLESTTETVLYRVIQESVNNVIKHANATSLDILLLCDKNEVTVSIEDNGRGFDTADKNKFSGIGLKNMISRVEYLKGSVDISSANGKGTLVAIFIPLT